MKELDLGTGNIGKLIKKFSIPCVISMVVAALYNIVDQIFIGWSEAGAYGNAATNIVTMLWAAIISDVVSAIFGFWFVSTEIHKHVKMYDEKEKHMWM